MYCIFGSVPMWVEFQGVDGVRGILVSILESTTRWGLCRLWSYVLSPGWLEKQMCGSSFSRSNLDSLNTWTTLPAQH